MSSTVRPSYSFRQLPLFDVKPVKTVQNVTSPHSLNFIPKSEVTVDGGGTVNLEMAVDATHILWRVGSGVWNKLIELSELKGEPGEGEPGKDGKDGKEVSLTKGITHIEWKLGDGNWISLVPLSELKGNDGVDGIDGIDGISGTDGKEISLQVTQSNMLQQRLGTGAWSDVFNLTNLVPNLSSYIKDTDLSDDFTENAQEEIAIDWSKMPKVPFSATPISGTFTLKPEHSGKYFYTTAATDFVITLEAGITEPITIFQKGNGRAEIVGDTGVDLFGERMKTSRHNATIIFPVSNSEYHIVHQDLDTFNSEIYVDALGNVGIGTTTPRGKLDLNGDLWIGNAPSTNNIYFGNASNFFGRGTIVTTQTELLLSANYWSSVFGQGGYITLKTKGGGLFRLTDVGLVGIGKDNPSEKLDVDGKIKGLGYVSADGSDGVSGTFTDSNGQTITIKNGIITNIS